MSTENNKGSWRMRHDPESSLEEPFDPLTKIDKLV